MTDARMPERWLNDRRVNRLSDAAFRAFVNAYMWSVSNRTDGIIQPEDLSLIRGLDSKTLAEMIGGELAERQGESWLLVDFEATQTSKSDLEVLENARRADRDKKRRDRAAKRVASLGAPAFTSSPGDSLGDFLGDSTGEDRTGEARTSALTTNDKNAEDPWASVEVAEPGKPRRKVAA